MSIRFINRSTSSAAHSFQTARLRLSSLLPILLLVPLIFISCEEDDASNGTSGKDTTSSSGPAPIDTAGLPAFSGQGAYDYVAKQVAFGTREPQSSGAKKAIAFYLEELGNYADYVNPQEFTHTGYNGETLNLTNIVASFNPDAGVRILLCAHWDSRPRADWDPDSTKHSHPILAANDGASGVAVLLELAKVFKENPPPIGVDIVLFDGEDYGNSDIDNLDQYFLGARHFSKNLPAGYRPAFGILLDMVGDKEAEFTKEAYSMKYAEPFVNALWSAALQMGLNRFKQRRGKGVQDDHLMLNEIAGIPTLDIIDGDLVGHESSDPRRHYWHTHKDNMDNISTSTLEEVGRLLTYTVYRWLPAQVKQAS